VPSKQNGGCWDCASDLPRLHRGKGGAEYLVLESHCNSFKAYPLKPLQQNLLPAQSVADAAYATNLYVSMLAADFCAVVKAAAAGARGGTGPAARLRRRLEPESAAPKVASAELSPANRPLWNDRERAGSALRLPLLDQRARQSPLRAKTGHRSGGQHCRT
jgi:hypothetical protein